MPDKRYEFEEYRHDEDNSVGRPRSGNINAERLGCKYRYKQAIKDFAFEADQRLNDDLFQYMCSKDNDSFWKS